MRPAVQDRTNAHRLPPVGGRRTPSLPRALAWGFFIWIAVVWGVRGAAGFAAEASPETAWEATIGFDGVYRTGSWTPLLIAPSTATRVWVEDPDGELVGYPPVSDGGSSGQGGAKRRAGFVSASDARRGGCSWTTGADRPYRSGCLWRLNRPTR